MSIYDRLTRPPGQSFFLFGVRGAGKSTWARQTFPDAAYVDLLDERLYQDLLADASLFGQSIGHLAPGDWVVVDEVQRLPTLLNEVHRLIETRRLRCSSTACRPSKRVCGHASAGCPSCTGWIRESSAPSSASSGQ